MTVAMRPPRLPMDSSVKSVQHPRGQKLRVLHDGEQHWLLTEFQT